MNLQERLKDTKYHGTNLLIAEFDHDFAVAYEKRTGENPSLIYGLIPDFGNICGWDITGENETGSVNHFSGEVQQIINSYQKQRQTIQKKLREETAQVYQDITSPLGIKKKKDRKLGLLLGSSLVTVTYPISVPIILSRLLKQREKSQYTEAMPELVVVGAPWILVNTIAEAISPLHYENYYKITNKRVLSKDNNNGKRTALLFYSLDDEFKTWSSWLWGIGHPYDGSPARSSSPPRLLFPDGKELSEGGFVFQNRLEGEYGAREQYSAAQHFLDVESSLEDKLDQLMTAQNRESRRYSNFEQELRQSKDSQLTLLLDKDFIEI